MRRTLFLMPVCLWSVWAQQAPAGFSPEWIDGNVNPCVDFYRYACGNWIARNPLPAEYSRYTRFNELQRRNEALLKEVLEKASVPGAGRTGVEQRIGDFYAACMDEETIEKQGLEPLRGDFDRIAQLKTVASLAPLIADLHLNGVGVLFRFGATPDYKNSKQNIAAVMQGGLGLPDRDYYLKDDAATVSIREKYVEHMARMFELAGDGKQQAAGRAKAVMALETALAQASMDRVSMRDPNKRYHKMSREELAKLAPAFDWTKYFVGTAAPGFSELNVGMPDFLRSLSALLTDEKLEDWKSYLRWHVLHEYAGLLPRAFVEEDFRFYRQTLTGAKEMQPRWRRCVQLVDRNLGEALGQKFVERAFPPEAKARMLELVRGVEKALEKDIAGLEWMSAETKKRALEKLKMITNKIGYPDRWTDYSAVRVVRGDAVGNLRRATQFAERRDLEKIGKPVDPNEWRMTPPTVNAYYSPLENNINFPAGILQPPFFDLKMDDAVNLGGIGAVIGHELTHGFDDSGRKFDGEGNLRDWWTESDAVEFEKRAQCFIEQYGSYEAAEGARLNGKLTLGENVADNGGLRIAYMALRDTLEGKEKPVIDGYTPEQRLFLGWAQVWCGNATEQEWRLRARTDPHAPGEFRVNGTVSNMPEFQSAFGCVAGQPMVREPACRIW